MTNKNEVKVYSRWRVGVLCLWGVSGLIVLTLAVLLVTRMLIP
jgi:hypothetical protein